MLTDSPILRKQKNPGLPFSRKMRPFWKNHILYHLLHNEMGCSVHWSFHINSIVFPMTFPHIYHEPPLPVYSWYPSVLMICPRCTEHPPLYCTPSVYSTVIMQSGFPVFYVLKKISQRLARHRRYHLRSFEIKTRFLS